MNASMPSWAASVHPFTASFIHRYGAAASEELKSSMIDSLNRLPGGKNSDKGRLLNDLYLLNGLKGVPQEVLAAIRGILVASDKWMRRHVCNYRELTAQADPLAHASPYTLNPRHAGTTGAL